MSEILVTGAGGFVGRHVLNQMGGVGLVDATGASVDLRDLEAVKQSVNRIRPSGVIHLAAISSIVESTDDPGEQYRTNFWGTYNLLQALAAAEFRGRMVFAGSGAVYGDASKDHTPFVETDPLRPISPYSVSKIAAEALCYQWSRSAEFEIVMARPFNHIGPGQDRRFSISDFTAQIVEIKLGLRAPVMRVGNVAVSRDFTDVRDVVRAYGLLLEQGENGEIYNICSGIGRRLDETIQQLAELAGVSITLEAESARVRRNDVSELSGNPQKLKQATGWMPQIEWEQSLRDIISNWESELGG